MNWNYLIVFGLEIVVSLYLLYLLVSKISKPWDSNSPPAHLAKFLGKSMEENSGSPSLMRWMNFYAELIWAPVIAAMYVVVCVKGFQTGNLSAVLPFTNSLLGAIILMLGLKGGVQKYFETKEATSQNSNENKEQ